MGGRSGFPRLLEPYHIGKLRTKNRIIKTAALWGDLAGNESVRLYEAMAKGGAGVFMIPTEVFSPQSVDPAQSSDAERVRIPGYGRLSDVVHEQGGLVFLEVMHRGCWQVGPPGAAGPLPVSASSLPGAELPLPSYDRFAANAKELSASEIKAIVDEFANFAEEAWRIGFDGVEINASRCHLFNSFLSRFWNRRDDEYGCGTLENRARIVVEVMGEIKRRLGQDFPVAIQMNAVEYALPNGLTVEEGKGIARVLEQAGADALEVRAYGYGEHYNRLHIPEQILYPEPPEPLAEGLDGSHQGRGLVVPLAAAIRSAVSIPIITVGKITAVIGEKALRDGSADFIGMCRGLVADPEAPNKLASGRAEDIAPCTTCMECFRFYGRPDVPIRCRVNANVGRQEEYGFDKAAKKKKVVVVGGGPGGMEAARVAALRGHEVTLFEKEPRLGGLLPLAAVVKGLEIEDLVGLLRYLETQVRKAGVRIRTGQEANLPAIDGIKPDVVILATGSVPVLPEIPGIDNPIVVRPADLHDRTKLGLRFFGPAFVRWLTKLWMPVGKRVLVIGGSMHGCELAEFFVKRGRKVTIVDTAEAIASDMIDLNRGRLFAWFRRKGVTTIPQVTYEAITDKGLVIRTREGNRQTIEADTIVPAIPPVSNRELLNRLEGKVPEIYSVGDCREPRLILEAIADGARAGRAI